MPLILLLPTIVTDPTGIKTNIVWSAFAPPPWLSLGEKITINSSDPTLVDSNPDITITATDSISGLSISNTFKVLFQCTTTSVNCSSSILSSLTYFITDTTELTIPTCEVSPSFCRNEIVGTLTSIETTSPPEGFSLLTKNPNNSYKIKINSNDVSLDGKTYKF